MRWELGIGVAEPHLAGGRARALVVRGILLPGAFQPQTFWVSFQCVCVCVCVCVCDGEEEVAAGEKDAGKGLWGRENAGHRTGGTLRRDCLPQIVL